MSAALFELVRHDIVRVCRTHTRSRSALLLASRSLPEDSAAWDAVTSDLAGRTGLSYAAHALSQGCVEDAAMTCANVCGLTREEWETETRREIGEVAR